MSKCLVCGKETEGVICNECRSITDISLLCNEIIDYKIKSGGNPLWDDISSNLADPYGFRNVVLVLSGLLQSPEREIIQIHLASGNGRCIFRSRRDWFLEMVDDFLKNNTIDPVEESYIRGLQVEALLSQYDYISADRQAASIKDNENNDKRTIYTLADFYMKTRRYDVACGILNEGILKYANDPYISNYHEKLKESEARRIGRENGGIVEFMPNPSENKEQVRTGYVDFLASIGIKAELPELSTYVRARKRTERKKIPKNEYPKPVEKRKADFNSFVAFDLETTGLNTDYDAIIEIGAIRVVDGNVIEEPSFIFQEFVHPYKQGISKEVEDLTGISREMTKNARQMWEVFPDFADFIGDNILVGFNCMKFDSKFLVRAGRYSNLIINNKYFDVMKMAEGLKNSLNISSLKLDTLSKKLNIVNPKAHRALADAITTAKVYLELKKFGAGETAAGLDDFLENLDKL